MRIDARRHRADLIAAAARVFTRDGYRAPLEAVVEEAGVGRGTLYRHFRDRDALIVAVMEDQLDAMTRFVAEHRGSPTLLRELLRLQAEAGVMASGAIEALIEADALRLVEPLKTRADELYRAVIAEARGRGQVPEAFDLRDIRLVMRMVVGAARGENAAPQAEAQAMEAALDIILRGLQPE